MKKLLRLLTLLLLVITPTVLAACNNTYRDIEIVASSLEGERSISMYVGDERELTFNVYKLPNNATGRLSFTRGDSIISQPTVVSYNQTNHENVIKFSAITFGTTDIKVIAEGGNSILIEVKVFERITDFTLKNELVLVREDDERSSLKLTSDLFNFYPLGTDQTQLEFVDQENKVLTDVNLEDYEEQSEINLKVRSIHLDRTKDLNIKIVDQIKPFDFYSEENKLVSEEQKTSESQASILYISANKKQEFSFKKIKAVIEGESNLISANVSSKNNKVLVAYDENEREIVDGNTTFNFVVSVGGFDSGEEDIVFEAFYTDVDKTIYRVVRTFKVVIVEYPNKIFVNNMDSANLDPIILHIGYHREITQNIKIDLYPLNAKFDSVDISYNTSYVGGQRDIAEFVEFKYNEQVLDFNKKDIKFDLPIVARGVKDTEESVVFLNLSINYGSQFSNQGFVEEVSIPIKVMAGASQLLIEEEWQSGEIYVSQNQGPVVFAHGLYVNESSAFLSDVEVRPLTAQSSQIARIEPQTEIISQTKKYLPIKIYPISPGQARFNIVLANGVSKQIRVVVVPEISSFKVDYDKSNSSPTTITRYDSSGNIEALSMQMQQEAGQYYIKTKFNFTTDIANYLSLYPNYYKLTQTISGTASYDQPLRILTVGNLDANGISNNQQIIEFKLNLFKIDNFKLVDTTDLPEQDKQGYEFVYGVKYNAFLPLTKIAFTQNQLELFSESHLGVYYKSEASKEVNLEFSPSIVKQVFENSASNPNIKLEYYAANINSKFENGILTVGDDGEYGTYDVESGIFTLDYKASTIAPFDIIARATYYERVYIARFTVIPKEYIRPNSIQFSDYVDSIYLDATRPTSQVNMYVLPNNATHKIIDFEIESAPGFDSAALNVQITENYTKLLVSYNSQIQTTGHAYIVLKPRASIEEGAPIPANSRRIKVDIGSGTYENPYRIYSSDQLLNIAITGLDKHYMIMSRIDLSHITNFKPIGKFTGSLRGEGAQSEIFGVNISGFSSLNKNAGLFTAIEPQRSVENQIIENTGLIKDIKISGSLNINLDSAASVGLVAGVLHAGAVLENVSATLTTSVVSISTRDSVNIGGVVGLNHGQIRTLITNNQKQYASLLTGAGTLTVNHTLNNTVSNNRSFVGGVAGVNKENAKIVRVVKEEGVQLYNAANYFVSLNMLITGNYPDNTNFAVGMIAGENLAIIQAEKSVEGASQTLNNQTLEDHIKLGGSIRIENQGSSVVGGIVGENKSSQGTVLIEGIVSRVRLASFGSGSATAYFGGAFGINNGATVSNIILQAIEDGTSIGINASMLYSDEFGLVQGTENRVGIFGYDATVAVPGQIAISNTLGLVAQTFVGSADNENVPSTKRKMVARTVAPSLGNYYGDFVLGNTPGVMFAPVSESFLVDEDEVINKLVSENSTSLMAYLQFYKAQDASDQELIDENDLNIYNILPFKTTGEILIVSLNTQVISVLNDGSLRLNSTGVAALQIYSMLNRKVLKTVYIVSTNSFDEYSLHLNNSSGANVDANNDIKITAQNAVNVVPVIKSEIDLSGYIVNLVPTSDLIFENTYDQGVQSIVFEKVGGTYVLRAINQAGQSTIFAIEAKIAYFYNGNLFVAENAEDKTINFAAAYYVGATKLNLSSSSLVLEPIEKTDITIELETDDFEDVVLINQFKDVLGSLSNADNSFVIEEKNRLYNISANASVKDIFVSENNILEAKLKISQNHNQALVNQATLDITINLLTLNIWVNGQNSGLNTWLDMSNLFTIESIKQYEYLFEIEVVGDAEYTGTGQASLYSIFKLNKVQKIVSVGFNPEKIDAANNYVGNYVIAFSSKTNTQIGSELLININAQSIGVISVSSFEGSLQGDIASGKQEYNYVDPMAKNKNHFRISVFPLQADFDYIRIDSGLNTNTSTQVNTIFTLLNLNGTSKSGARNVANGLVIDKALITDDIYVRYSVEMMNLFNEDAVPFVISVYKNNQVIYNLTKIVNVKFKQDVFINIEGKQEKEGVIFLTRGSTYSFNLSSNGYRDSEVVIEAISAPIAQLFNVSIPSRTLTITSNVISYPINNQRIDIRVYGRKTVNGEVVQSSPQELSLMVVEYLILENDEYIPVRRAANKLASVSIGDTLTFEVEFILGQTVEYQPAIASIASTVEAFENAITQRGSWQYQMGVLNAQGDYEYSLSDSSWTTLSAEAGKNVDLSQTDGYFTISKNKDGRFVFTPHKVLNLDNPPYKFRFVYGYDYINGRAEFSTLNRTVNEFMINVYQMSAIDSPTPIYTVAQLQAMNQGSYYILMNDIVIPSNFTPISTEIGGLDGNNKKIIINSNMSFETTREFVGLFTTIGARTLIRNLNIEITSNVVITITKTNMQSVYFGVLAGQNSGIITNTSIRTLPNANLRIVFIEPANSSINYAATLVGYNAIGGSITHSRVEASIYSSSSLAGFMGYNRGKVSNSYVYNSLIVNTSARIENKTAGFVVINAGQDGDGGQITSSYVSGAASGFTIYSNSANRIIQSSREVGGFVYENNGSIFNSYSNIPVSASSNSAGFVFVNYGNIENTYSTSLMKETSEGTYGFIKTNYGTLKNNYFLRDEAGNINDTINESNNYVEGLSPYSRFELKDLKISEFSNKSNFVNYVFTPSKSLTRGVWFFPEMPIETQFNNSQKTFTIGKPELIAANHIAISEMEIDFDRTIENTQTGEVDYVYKNSGEFYQGSTYNPIIITSAQELETRIIQSSSGVINTNSFRIVDDLDYGQDSTSSNLYKLIFAGDIEGNGMTISNYTVNTSQNMASAGLFSKIGIGTSGQGTVKNIEIKPAYINLPNTNAVGALAGTIESATLFNIKVNGETTTNLNVMIIGKNLVGGVFGRATGNYYLSNISSNISITASYRSAISINPNNPAINEKIGSYYLFRTHTTDILSRLSYSGSVGGVLAGSGVVSNIKAEGNIVSNSEWASLVFGGVGNGVWVKDVDVALNQNQILQASAYAGVVAAEFYGRMENVNVASNQNFAGLYKTETYKPYGIGGVVGLMGTGQNNGSIGASPTLAYNNSENNLKSGLYKINASFDVISSRVDVAGGIVAHMLSGNISDAVFKGSVVSALTAGGIVGKINDTSDAPIAVGGSTMKISSEVPNIKNTQVLSRADQQGVVMVDNDNKGIANVGGVVGVIETSWIYSESGEKLKVSIENTKVNVQVRVSSIIYGGNFDGVYVGGIVGKVSKKTGLADNADIRLSITNTVFENRIIMSLRNLNLSSINEGNEFENEMVGYGFVVAIYDENVAVETKSTSNTVSETHYKGEVGSRGHYLLFKYIQNGKTHDFDQSNSTQTVFVQTII